jgi:DNA-directed RNA polymerase subunit RPC12/RpoP
VSGKLSEELTCPDCGGHIGEGGAAGTKPCSCFDQKPARKRPVADEPDPADMRPNMSGGTIESKKICRFCGKDLTGRSRMKDELGYICKKCSDEDFAEQEEREKDLMRCPECERKLKPSAFVEYRGNLICGRCKMYHQENDKLKVGKVKLTKHKEHEKKTVTTLAIVFGVLAMILIIKSLFF